MKFVTTLVSLFIVNAASATEPLCFAKVAQAAKDKMVSDAIRLFGREVSANLYSVTPGAAGTYLLPQIPNVQFPNNTWPETYLVNGEVVAHDRITSEGSRMVDDRIVVYVVSGTCDVVAVTRTKEKTFVGCYGSCNNAPPSDGNVFNELYRKTEGNLK